MLRKSLLMLFVVSGSLAGCERREVEPGQVSVASAAKLFDRPGDVEIKMNAATLRAIESGLSAPAIGTRISRAADEISGVARYEFGDGVSYPAKLVDGDTRYDISSTTRLHARRGQLVRFTATVDARAGQLTGGRFEVLPFAGNPRDKLAWDALQLVATCASANREFAPSLFNTYEKMEAVKLVRIDAENPGNGSVVLTTARERIGYVYRCALKDGKLVALQAHENGPKTDWEPMSALMKRRADGAIVSGRQLSRF